MAWSGGVFTRTNGVYSGATVWAQDNAAAVKIVYGRHDTHDQDIAQGVNACLNKNGQNSPTASIDWGGFKITNMAVGSAVTDSATYGQTITAAAFSAGTLTLTRNAGNLTAAMALADIVAALGYTPSNDAIPPDVHNANYTFAATDRSVIKTDGIAYAWTIDPFASVAIPVGTLITLRIMNAAGNITITRGAGVALRKPGAATDANLTFTPWGLVTLYHETTDNWICAGVGV
jgi:hypothetical protein